MPEGRHKAPKADPAAEQEAQRRWHVNALNQFNEACKRLSQESGRVFGGPDGMDPSLPRLEPLRVDNVQRWGLPRGHQARTREEVRGAEEPNAGVPGDSLGPTGVDTGIDELRPAGQPGPDGAVHAPDAPDQRQSGDGGPTGDATADTAGGDPGGQPPSGGAEGQ